MNSELTHQTTQSQIAYRINSQSREVNAIARQLEEQGKWRECELLNQLYQLQCEVADALDYEDVDLMDELTALLATR